MKYIYIIFFLYNIFLSPVIPIRYKPSFDFCDTFCDELTLLVMM